MKKIFCVIMMCIFMLTGCGEKKEAISEVKTKLVVGMECDYAPFNWSQTKETEDTVKISDVDYADGYDVVIAKRIATELGLDLEIKKISWNGLIPALESGEIDAVIAGMTKTPEREKGATFTDPYYESDMVIVVRKGDSLANGKSLDDFSGKTILGQQNTLYDEVIDQIKEVVHATPQATVPRMILSLQEKEVDGIVVELPVAMGIVAANEDLVIVSFEKGKGFIADTTVSIAVKHGNTELQQTIQSVLNKITNEERLNIMKNATERQPAGE